MNGGGGPADWEVDLDAECKAWFNGLDIGIRRSILARLVLLRRFGPQLGRPHVDKVEGSAHSNMKELRVQHKGRPWRVLFAFDPDRQAILLVGGDKGGVKRWYKINVPIADARYMAHLETLGEE